MLSVQISICYCNYIKGASVKYSDNLRIEFIRKGTTDKELLSIFANYPFCSAYTDISDQIGQFSQQYKIYNVGNSDAISEDNLQFLMPTKSGNYTLTLSDYGQLVLSTDNSSNSPTNSCKRISPSLHICK